MAQDPVDITIGFKGAVRVKALPRITIVPHPATAPVTIAELQKKLALTGVCDNLRQPLVCALTWLFVPDGATGPDAARRVPHPGSVVIVPRDDAGELKKKPFDLKAQSDGKTAPLVLDILRLGLYGRGRLGYELAPGLRGAAPIGLAPADSGLSIELPIGLELLDLHDRPLSTTAPLRVGSQYRFRPRFAPAFAGKDVRITIQEVGAGYSGEKGVAHPFDRTITADPPASETMVVGFAGQQFDYRVAPAGRTETLRYGYTIAFLTTKGKQKIVDAQAVPLTGDLFTVPKPRLDSFALSVQRAPWQSLLPGSARLSEKSVLHVEGSFQGFETKQWSARGTPDDFTFPVEVSLFAHHTEPSLGTAVGKYAPVALPPTVLPVRGGRLAGDLDLHALGSDEWAKLAALAPQNLGLFAVVRFSTLLGCKAEKVRDGQVPQPLVFADVAEYAASDHDHPTAGMAPMGKRTMTAKAGGTGVCSNLVDLTGHTSKLGYEVGLDTEWDLGSPTRNARQNDYNDPIQQWADTVGFDALTYKSMIAQESAFEPTAHNAHGYAGLTQAGPSETKSVGRSIGGTSKASGAWVYDMKGDERFQPALSIEIGAKCLQGKVAAIDRCIQKGGYVVAETDRTRMIVGAYNIGEGVIADACAELAKKTKSITWDGLCGAGDAASPLWIAITKHPSVTGTSFTVEAKYREVTGYVKKILARAET